MNSLGFLMVFASVVMLIVAGIIQRKERRKDLYLSPDWKKVAQQQGYFRKKN